MATEITIGIAGAAGDGLDRTGDTLARTAARLGLHLFTYNSYQSLIRGDTPGCAFGCPRRRWTTMATT